MFPVELAEVGIASNDQLAHVLGASLMDHIDELDALTDEYNGTLKRITDLEGTVAELEAQNARFADIIKTLAKA